MEWTRGPVIGRGSSATVSVGTTSLGEVFAVKSAELSSSNSLQKEQLIISKLSSPFVIKCLGSDVTCEENQNKHIYNLFLEYVSGGTLSDQIKKQGGSLDEPAIQFYAHQMVKGLNYLHRNGIVHGDIKGQNILIGKDGIKIADFGCAKFINEDDDARKSSISGTPVYMAPEVASCEEQGFPADIWALGCTIIEMATGRSPWPETHDPVSALYRIGYSGDVPEIPGWLSGEAKDFLNKCLVRDAKLRWTAEEVLEHPFFHSLGNNKGEFTRKSPTSVIDKDFWDSFEVPEYSSRNHTVMASSSDSPVDRISRLIGDSLDIPNWTEEEEDWITVRGTDFEENLELPAIGNSISQDHDDHLNFNSESESFVYVNFSEEEFQISIAVEDSSSGICFNYEISDSQDVIKSVYVSRFLDYYETLLPETFSPFIANYENSVLFLSPYHLKLKFDYAGNFLFISSNRIIPLLPKITLDLI